MSKCVSGWFGVILFIKYYIIMEEMAANFSQQMTENYPMVKLEEQVLDFNLELYDPVKDEVINTKISDYAWKWLVLFFYPADFTFVCPTELHDLQKRYTEIQDLNDVVVLVGSTDSVFSHRSWTKDEGLMKGLQYPMFADRKGILTKYFGIMNHETGHAERGTFIISPEGVLKMIEIHTEPVGRSSHELVRKLKALKFVTENPGNACVASRDDDYQPTLQPSLQIAGDVENNLG